MLLKGEQHHPHYYSTLAINPYTWLMVWQWRHFLLASNTTRAATDRVCQITLNQKILCKLQMWCKFSSNIKIKLHKKKWHKTRPACLWFEVFIYLYVVNSSVGMNCVCVCTRALVQLISNISELLSVLSMWIESKRFIVKDKACECHEGIWWSGVIFPLILNPRTVWSWVVGFTPWLLFSQEKSPWYLLNRVLCRSQSQTRSFEGEKISLTPPGNRTTVVSCPVHCGLVIILAMLAWLPECFISRFN